VIFQFLYYPEYVSKGIYLIINENNLKAFGRVTHIFYDTINKFDIANQSAA
jgi:GTPase